MKIGDMLFNKWTGNIGIITHTEDDINFDVYWTIENKLLKSMHYSYLLVYEREAQKLKPR